MKVPTLRLLDYSIAELEERNLSILLPFYLLKLRKQIQAARSSKKRRDFAGAVKQLMEEILDTLERSEAEGLMSTGDMNQVLEMTGRIYDTLYKSYPEFKESTEMVYGTILTYSEEAALKAEKRAKARFTKNLKKMGLSREQIAQATQLDPEFPETEERLLTEEAEQRAKVHIAQNLIQEGLTREQIARTTGLDLPTVESLIRAAHP